MLEQNAQLFIGAFTSEILDEVQCNLIFFFFLADIERISDQYRTGTSIVFIEGTMQPGWEEKVVREGRKEGKN